MKKLNVLLVLLLTILVFSCSEKKEENKWDRKAEIMEHYNRNGYVLVLESREISDLIGHVKPKCVTLLYGEDTINVFHSSLYDLSTHHQKVAIDSILEIGGRFNYYFIDGKTMNTINKKEKQNDQVRHEWNKVKRHWETVVGWNEANVNQKLLDQIDSLQTELVEAKSIEQVTLIKEKLSRLEEEKRSIASDYAKTSHSDLYAKYDSLQKQRDIHVGLYLKSKQFHILSIINNGEIVTDFESYEYE